MKNIVVSVAVSELTLDDAAAKATVSVHNETAATERIVLTPLVAGFTAADPGTPSGQPAPGAAPGSAPAPASATPGGTSPATAPTIGIERSLREMPAGSTEQFLVTLSRGEAPPGRYALKFVASPSEEATEEYAERAGKLTVVVRPPVEEKRRPFPWKWLAAGAAMVVVIAVVAFLLLRPSPVTVPNVVGSPRVTAERTLTDARLRPTVTTTPGIKPLGVVVKQQPAAGAEVEEDTSVAIVVRSPLPVVIVTDLAVAEAQERLKGLGFTNITVVKGVAPGKAPDTVVEQEPAANTAIALDDPITLTVAQQLVDVPDVIGQPVRVAVNVLRQAGLTADAPDSCPTILQCRVAAQAPNPGSQVPVGSRVRLRVVPVLG